MAKKVKSKRGGGLKNYKIHFKKATITLRELFGKKPISPPDMMKVLWKYIKKHKLGKNKKKKEDDD